MTRIGWVRRAILSRQGETLWAPVWAALAVIVPALIRGLLDPWVSGVPFLTFFPALLIASVILGWGWGAVVLGASALAANYMYQGPGRDFALSEKELVATTGFVAFGALMIFAADTLRRAVIELEARATREAELNLELQHRVNNNLTVIQGLARQTARHSESIDAFYAAFSERLLAISEANRVLSRGLSTSALPDLAEAALRPFRSRGAVRIDGPLCRLPNNACVPLALCLHELATNATKYGALSVATGSVDVSWSLADGKCRLLWREAGGPTVSPPTRKGLGSRLLRDQSGLSHVSVEYPSAGVVCEIDIDGATAA